MLKLVNFILITVLVIYLLFAFSRTSPEPVRKRVYYDSGNIYDEPVNSGPSSNLSRSREKFTLNGVIPVQASSFLSTDTQINPINKGMKNDYYEIMTSDDIFIDDQEVYQLCDTCNF
ncbi:hypothetical protein RF11_08500 [Thelohanellus kitauei]|uniref:Uncharacterized protein n=1 Tax=Thelohanellus kitauei TaxID=669202 RepID=A0A0C2MEI4_THEKT|nr:hypothetical protein RF11_08500 [Thelohanellus kitauei]